MPVSECDGKRLLNRLIDTIKKITAAAPAHDCLKDLIFKQ